MTLNKNHIEFARDAKRELAFTDHSIFMRIKRVYTDVNGNVIAKGAAPVALQVKYPFFLFSEFDREGGYKQSLNFAPPVEGTYYLTSGVIGSNGFTSASVIGFTGFNFSINGHLSVGDIVHVFTDDLNAPNYFVWIIQNAGKLSIASIMANSKTVQKDKVFNRLWVDSVHYTTSNENVPQWSETINETRLDNLGSPRNDSFVPTIDRGPMNYLNNILILRLQFLVDQFIGYSSYILFSTEEIQFIFKMKK